MTKEMKFISVYISVYRPVLVKLLKVKSQILFVVIVVLTNIIGLNYAVDVFTQCHKGYILSVVPKNFKLLQYPLPITTSDDTSFHHHKVLIPFMFEVPIQVVSEL